MSRRNWPWRGSAVPRLLPEWFWVPSGMRGGLRERCVASTVVSNRTTLPPLSGAHLGSAEGCGPLDLYCPTPLDGGGMSLYIFYVWCVPSTRMLVPRSPTLMWLFGCATRRRRHVVSRISEWYHVIGNVVFERGKRVVCHSAADMCARAVCCRTTLCNAPKSLHNY